MTLVDTVVVGAGHAGLAMSACLTSRGVQHRVLERGDIGERWRAERWDSLTLLTPNWATQLPGYPYDGDEPDGFDSRDRYIGYLERYARALACPIQTHTTVHRVSALPDGRFSLDTSQGAIQARNVVAATGPFHEPIVPVTSRDIPPDVVQLHSNRYRNPRQLPDGAVLVVGSGNSGLQIVTDLLGDGRRVFVSVGRLRSLPRRYRGRDTVRWLIDMGALDTPASVATPELRRTPPPLLSGVGGGHDLNLADMASRGAIFAGRLTGVVNGRVHFSQDLHDTLHSSADAYRTFRTRVDRYIADAGITADEDPAPCADADLIPVLPDPVLELDLAAAGVRSVVWATGFRVAYDWIDVPVFEPDGHPRHQCGVTTQPGLYFLGLRWLSKYKSFFIYGVGEDADRIASHITSRSACS